MRKSKAKVAPVLLSFGQRMKLLRYERMQRKLKVDADRKLVEDSALKEFPNTINTSSLNMKPIEATSPVAGSKSDERSSPERALDQAIERIRQSVEKIK